MGMPNKIARCQVQRIHSVCLLNSCFCVLKLDQSVRLRELKLCQGFYSSLKLQSAYIFSCLLGLPYPLYLKVAAMF
eukprot:c38379_g1_i1 orf=194-421(-)